MTPFRMNSLKVFHVDVFTLKYTDINPQKIKNNLSNGR